MGMVVQYKHIPVWLLTLFARRPNLVQPFTVAVDCREPSIPNQATIRKKSTVGKSDRMEEQHLEEFDIVAQIRKDMLEQIREISPKNAPKILDEVKSGGFSLGKYFREVQFHISGEIANHGTTLPSRAVTGDKNIGKDEWPYGAATFLCAEDVETVAATLSKISDREFRTNYSPDDWDKRSTEYALFYFKEFASYYAEAAKAGHAMLVWAA